LKKRGLRYGPAGKIAAVGSPLRGGKDRKSRSADPKTKDGGGRWKEKKDREKRKKNGGEPRRTVFRGARGGEWANRRARKAKCSLTLWGGKEGWHEEKLGNNAERPANLGGGEKVSKIRVTRRKSRT